MGWTGWRAAAARLWVVVAAGIGPAVSGMDGGWTGAAGEWLKPGDPILHLVQMNPIRYSFRIESTTPPESIFNQSVTIYVPTLDKTFQGKVMYIKPSHDIGDMYQVWVDVENQWQDFQNLDGTEKQKGYWILQPGMRAEVRSIGK